METRTTEWWVEAARAHVVGNDCNTAVDRLVTMKTYVDEQIRRLVDDALGRYPPFERPKQSAAMETSLKVLVLASLLPARGDRDLLRTISDLPAALQFADCESAARLPDAAMLRKVRQNVRGDPDAHAQFSGLLAGARSYRMPEGLKAARGARTVRRSAHAMAVPRQGVSLVSS